MATSFVGYHTAYRGGTRVEDYGILYASQATTDDGEWVNMAGCVLAVYEIKGITTGTLDWYGSNAATAPAVTDDTEAQYGIITSSSTLVTQATADGIFIIPEWLMPRFVKLTVTVATTIDLTVNLKRVRYVG